jgi:hypothetical protein
MESIIALLLDKVKYFDCTVFRSENMENMKVNRNCPNRERIPISFNALVL